MSDAHDISRREFLNRLSLLSVLAMAWPAEALAVLRAAAGPLPAWADQDPWRTLVEVQEHLLPATEDGPGARDIRAIVYLRNYLEQPRMEAEMKNFILGRVAALNGLAREQQGGDFAALDFGAREALLRGIVDDSAWQRWLSRLLTFLLEALLADPVYGGNPGGAGWKWLQHQPGFPTPRIGKRWYELGAPVYFQRKA